MLKQSKLRTQRQQHGIAIYTILILVTVITLSLNHIDSQLKLGVSIYFNTLLCIMISSVFLIQAGIWLLRNKAYKGFKYALYHYYIMLKLRKAFLDSGYYNKRFYFNNEIAELPKIKLAFDSGLSKAMLHIQNINLTKDISSDNISYALNNFIVDRSYLSNNENYYVFEIYDSSIDQQLNFENFKAFKSHSEKMDDYTLFIDSSTYMPLYGSLIVGQTGSGKTYALYSLILQMLIKDVNYNIYFADPKNSSLAILGEEISEANTATDIDEIIELLQQFNNFMQLRKKKIKEKLNTKLEGTYADFDYEPYIFIFDEFASFQAVLQTMEKKKRDEVMKLLSQIVLQGRQLGFFLWIVMQKSDATLLPTNLRENLPVKYVLGNAEKQTYTTAFGNGVDIPDRQFQLGQGVFTCPIVANTPKVCHFSYLEFDILEAVIHLKK